MHYRQISCDTWNRAVFGMLESFAQLLYLFLRTCPETHACGLFKVTLYAIGRYLRWPEDRIRASLEELSRSGLAFWDESSETVYIPDMMQDNLRSPKIIASAIRQAKVLDYSPHAQRLTAQIGLEQSRYPIGPDGTLSQEQRAGAGAGAGKEKESPETQVCTKNKLIASDCRDIAEEFGLNRYSYSRNDTETRWSCPNCKDNQKLCINAAKNEWFCHGCNVGGGSWKLVAHVLGADPNDKKTITKWLKEHGLTARSATKGAIRLPDLPIERERRDGWTNPFGDTVKSLQSK